MARYLYGGGGDGDIIQTSGLPFTNTTALVYTARTGGTIITDLQSVAGSAITQVTTDAYGQAIFFGPDNFISILWLDFGSGPRWALSPKAVDLAATRAIAVQRAADNSGASHTAKALLPYNAADPLEQNLAATLDPLVIPRFSSQGARDSAFPSPANGDRCYRTDALRDEVYGNSSWHTMTAMGAWTSDTPTLTASGGGFLLGSGSSGLRYQITGASVQFYLWFTFASDTAYGTGTWSVTALPFSLAGIALSVQPFYGQANSSAGRFSVVAQLSSATSLLIWGPASATNLALTQLQAATAVGGGTWGSGSFIRIGGTAQLA